jgi:diguanylate cyclase (GGDEF)-like protein
MRTRRLPGPALLAALLWAGVAAGGAAAAAPAPPEAGDPDLADTARCMRLGSADATAAVELARAMLARPGASAVMRIRANVCMGVAQSHIGDAQAARAAARAALDLLEHSEVSDEERMKAYNMAGLILITIGDVQQAATQFERFYAFAKRLRDAKWQIVALGQRARIASDFLDDQPAAERLTREALELGVAAHQEDANLYYTYGMILVRMQRYEDALPMLDRALDLLPKDPPEAQAILGPRIRTHRAEALAARGRTAEARALLEASLETQRDLPDALGETVTLTKLGRMQLAAGETDAALDSARRADALAERGNYRLERQQALQLLADVQAARGDAAAALATARRAFELEAANLRNQNLQSIAGLQALHDEQAELDRVERADLLRDLAFAALLLFVLFAGAIGLYQRRVNQRLRLTSNTDPLTGLLNRRAASRQLAAMSTRAGDDRHAHVLMLLDADRFKAINDEYGHEYGDEILLAISARLQALCGAGDIVARWGGEEFLVARADSTLAEAEHLAERLRAGVSETPILLTDGRRLAVTLSIGFAPWPFFPDPEGNPWKDSLQLADQALYAAKHAGRDAWVGLWGTPDGAGTPMRSVRQSVERAQLRGWITVRSSRSLSATALAASRAGAPQAAPAQATP